MTKKNKNKPCPGCGEKSTIPGVNYKNCMHNNIEELDDDAWGMKEYKRSLKKEKVTWNELCFVWFVLGLAVATVVLHYTIISPLLNSCI